MKLANDLKEFLQLLHSHGVEFVVVGGHAVAFHGFPRFTGDLDIFVGTAAKNAQAILAALAAFGFSGLLEQEDLLMEGRVIQLGRPPNRVDLLTSISGVAFKSACEEAVDGVLGGVPVKFLSYAHVLANKRASGRPKDLLDVQVLEDLATKPGR